MPASASQSSAPALFTVEHTHPATQLGGGTLTVAKAGRLELAWPAAGRWRIVLQATAPLVVVAQQGVQAELRAGWDGTLGYARYALLVHVAAAGTGWVALAAAPVPAALPMDTATFAARPARPPDSPASFTAWQAAHRTRLAQQLMLGGLPPRVPLAAAAVEEETRAAYTLRRVRYRSQADRHTTLLLALPHAAAQPVPLLVALHGHEATWGAADAGAFSTGHADDFCALFAERGWAVVQPATMDHTLQHRGWTLQGEWTWDAMVALDYALAQPAVDATRVAVCGLSTGAHLAINLLALDARVRAGVVAGIFSTWHHYRTRLRIPPHCDCGILAQLGDWLEPCDWVALAAPTPVQFQHGRQDAAFAPDADPRGLDPAWNTAIMPGAELATAWAEVQRAYAVAGAAGQAHWHLHAAGHRVDALAAHCFLTTALALPAPPRPAPFPPPAL